MDSNRLKRGGKLTIIVLAIALGVVSSSVTASQNQSFTKNSQNQSAERGQVERFDMLVREDVFAGLAGDTARFDKAMKFIEETLAKNPKHAQAMVWHGGGVFTRAGWAFQKGDTRKGGELWQKGLDEMNAAVALEPETDTVAQKLAPSGRILSSATARARSKSHPDYAH